MSSDNASSEKILPSPPSPSSSPSPKEEPDAKRVKVTNEEEEEDTPPRRTTRSKATTKMEQIAKQMVDDTKSKQPFSSTEIDMVIQSLQNVVAHSSETSNVDFEKLKDLIQEVAHESHKNWTHTGLFATRLHALLLPDHAKDHDHDNNTTDDDTNSSSVGSSSSSAIEDPSNAPFRTKFERVLQEGNWKGAIQSRAQHRQQRTNNNNAHTISNKPWIVLVTGVNGIRKTTSVYQPWFTKLLKEALVVPQDYPSIEEESLLPCGHTSFFRQLDHMIAILANQEFQQLYTLEDTITDVELYSTYKAAIFTRYRTLSEMLGIVLVREAQLEGINVMVETSGRDIAMFQYADEFFDASQYNKLVLHFTIDDIRHAEHSVDTRMADEIRAGQKALKADNIQDIVNANQGGPYGSQVLKGVQRDSDKVWNSILDGQQDIGTGWYKATIEIHGKNADEQQPWTANALKPDGTKGTSYEFPVRT